MSKQNLFGIPSTEILEKAKTAKACARAIEVLEAHITNKANILEHKDLSEWAYWYVYEVIKGRWPKAEETIKQNSRSAYFYAYDVIKDRWPEAEETIKQDPKWAYYYARDVIKGRWLEAEDVINQDPKWACQYARDVSD